MATPLSNSIIYLMVIRCILYALDSVKHKMD